MNKNVIYGVIISIINIIIVIISITMYTNDFANKADNRMFYQTANQIDNKADYDYMLQTEAGSSIVQTRISGINPISLPQVTTDKKYIYLHARYEEYLSHIETYTEVTTDAEGNTQTEVKTRIVWEWEYVGSDSKTVDQIEFYGHKYPIALFNLKRYNKSIPLKDLFKDSNSKSNYQSTGYHKRTIWTGIAAKIDTTFYADLNENGLQPIKFPNQKRDTSIRAHANQPIDKFLENELSANTPKPVLWTIITVFLMIFTTTGIIFLISNYDW